MRAHIESTYKDGFKNVRFCVVCGKEDAELIGTDCQQEKVEKEVDNKMTGG